MLASVAWLATPAVVRAQSVPRLPVLGFLSPHRMPSPEALEKTPFRIRLRELGWVDRKTLQIENSYGEGNEDRLPDLAAVLVAKKVDVIFAGGPEAAIAAARVTRTIPIVFWGVAFPVEQGLVDSFARPGRNVTGVAWFASPEVEGKRLELLREIAPAAKRLALITVPSAVQSVAGGTANFQSPDIVASQQLGYLLHSFPVEKVEDFDSAFAAILAWGAEALSVWGTTLTVRERKRIVDFANRNRLPSAFTLDSFVEAGGLVSYHIDQPPTRARAADYVDRILRGAKPGELPVELPARYLTAVNLKTAKALGLRVPHSFLLRADRVVE